MVVYGSEESVSSKEIIMIAPDLDLTTMTEEDKATLISLGWDFTGEVPTLVRTEEDLGFEIADSVAGTTIDLGDLFEDMDQNIDQADNNTQEAYDTGFTVFSLPSMEVGGGGMYVPIFNAPPHGSKVYKNGNLVHCNRFNGPRSDGRHLKNTSAGAIRNFLGSDCDTALARGICKVVKDVCNTTTRYHRAWCSWQIGHRLTYHKH